MPVTMLLVEGHLDAEVLRPLFAGRPVVERRGSKYALRPIALDLRRETNRAVCYIRDRDFDFDPPDDRQLPTQDSQISGSPLGWRWCRHAIEGYLLDPAVVAMAMAWDPQEYQTALSQAASTIRHYTAARWAVGSIRRELPPQRELRTEPVECSGEFMIPSELSEDAVSNWAVSHVRSFGAPLSEVLSETSIKAHLARRKASISDTLIADTREILVWFSGKDLLAGLATWLASRNWTPGNFRAALRDWVIGHPDEALTAIPEWAAFRQLLSS